MRPVRAAGRRGHRRPRRTHESARSRAAGSQPAGSQPARCRAARSRAAGRRGRRRPQRAQQSARSRAAGSQSGRSRAARSVAPGRPVVVVDPGHQLGNFTHTRQIARSVDAGGFLKPCNTTGTVTESGYRESAFSMSVANHLKARLTAQGATVHLTRPRESTRLWGPCVDVRGRVANKVRADLLVSIHADGSPSRFSGFFVIRPAYKKGLTGDIYRKSGVLARDVRAGLDAMPLKRANYLGGDGLDTRPDMGTLNLSNAPAVMVELGNMKNAGDARRMRSASKRDTVYAAGLARGVTSFLTR